MKTKLRGLTATALLLSASHMTLADGGDSSIVGDLPGYGEEAYFSEDATYSPAAQVPAASRVATASAVQTVGDLPVAPVAHQYVSSGEEVYAPEAYPAESYAPEAYPPEAYPSEAYPPVGVGDLRHPGHYAGPSSSYCDGASCDGGCDSGCCGGSRFAGMQHRVGRIGKMLGLSNNTWAVCSRRSSN